MADLGTYIGLLPRKYKIYLHDSSFFSFFYSFKPNIFPDLEISLKLKKSMQTLFFSTTKHINLNRPASPCKDNPDYSFHLCVRTSLARKIGCKLPWDKWISDSFKVCDQVQDILSYDESYRAMALQNLNRIISNTGCLKPCEYTEYTLVKNVKQSLGNDGSYLHFSPNDVINIEKELVSYSGLSLVADIGGSLGMFLGFSFLMVWDVAVTLLMKIREKLMAKL